MRWPPENHRRRPPAPWLSTRLNAIAGEHSTGYSNTLPRALIGWRKLLILLMPGEGFEPPTFGLQNRCTTTVLTRQGADFSTCSAQSPNAKLNAFVEHVSRFIAHCANVVSGRTLEVLLRIGAASMLAYHDLRGLTRNTTSSSLCRTGDFCTLCGIRRQVLAFATHHGADGIRANWVATGPVYTPNSLCPTYDRTGA